MLRRATRAKLNRVFGLLLLFGLARPLVSAQLGIDFLSETKQKLESLRLCLTGDDDVERLATGLLEGYGDGQEQQGGGYGRGYRRQQPLPPPRDYLDSMDRDIRACFAARKLKDADQRKELLAEVREDIRIKADDCRKFGMGRMVTVRVTTLKGPVVDSGWEVFYKWQCASDFHPAEIRASQLTSPATLKLPPGNYAIRAQKRGSDQQLLNTATVTVVVGLETGADVQLPVQ